jgi:ABC-type multidrug transport system permease subunit
MAIHSHTSECSFFFEILLANKFFPQTFIGYQQPKPDMHPWFVWIYWINPLSYGFESLMGNEFHDR